MSYSWQINDFDSKIIKFKTAKINYISKIGDIEKLLKDFKDHSIEYATFRVRSNKFQTIHQLEKSGFVLVDGILSMSANLDNLPTIDSSDFIHEAKIDDLKELKKLAKSVFSITRYYNDTSIKKENSDEIYAKWIENSLNGYVADCVLKWMEGNRVKGFVTIQKNGHIPLIAVSETARGKGIARKLIIEAFKKINSWGIKKSEIETQIQNIPAIRAYQACGFKIVDSFLTFRWMSS